MTTATFASGCGSEWDDDIIEGLAEPTTLNDQIYVFGKRRWVKPSRKWRKSTSQVHKEEKQSKLDIAGNAQARTINGVFMFGSAARKVTETKSSLPALQEFPSHQELVRNQIKPRKSQVAGPDLEDSE